MSPECIVLRYKQCLRNVLYRSFNNVFRYRGINDSRKYCNEIQMYQQIIPNVLHGGIQNVSIMDFTEVSMS